MQNWRCGMNRTLSLSAKVCAQNFYQGLSISLNDNLEKVSFAYQFIAELEQIIYMAVLPCKISVQITG